VTGTPPEKDNRMKRNMIIATALFLLLATGQAGTAQEKPEITVSAALSLRKSFEELGRLFELRRPGTLVRFNFAASGVLERQIEGGAPVDVFASAAAREMDELDRRNLLAPGTSSVFARNEMVLIVPRGSTLGVSGLADLGMENVRRIVIGNPATVPAGKYADEVLQSLGLRELVREKLVFAENVRQAVDYTLRGEVDAGIVFATDVAGVTGVTAIDAAPAESHSPALYYAAVIRKAVNAAAAQAFVDLLLSNEGQAVLAQKGFLSAR
jgi:molybdate transport system substrate-binding protein